MSMPFNIGGKSERGKKSEIRNPKSEFDAAKLELEMGIGTGFATPGGLAFSYGSFAWVLEAGKRGATARERDYSGASAGTIGEESASGAGGRARRRRMAKATCSGGGASWQRCS